MTSEILFYLHFVFEILYFTTWCLVSLRDSDKYENENQPLVLFHYIVTHKVVYIVDFEFKEAIQLPFLFHLTYKYILPRGNSAPFSVSSHL